ncbi:MAG: glycoside hydrolase family 65 protein [Spirochaetales bacterium]|nr:glycoside hydrolase family 65 protein [Spirochaetales bacterium]
MNQKPSSWKITRNIKSAELPENLRTLLFSGNGYLGVQASLPFDNRPAGTFINGFYESTPITYGEKAYGYPALQQVMIPLVDLSGWYIFKKIPGGELPLNFRKGEIEIDMLRGIRTLTMHLSDDQDIPLICRIETLTSLTNPHRVLIRTSLDGEGEYRGVRIISKPHNSEEESSDPRKTESLGAEIFAVSQNKIIEKNPGHPVFTIQETTRETKLSYSCSLGFEQNSERTHGKHESPTIWEDHWNRQGDIRISKDFNLSETGKASWTMACVFMTSIEVKTESLSRRTVEELNTALSEGWKKAEKEQAAYLKNLWESSDIRISEDPELTLALRYNTFGLIQSTGKDRRWSAAAKGLSSSGYNGHYFWDADIYVQAALNNIQPERARSLIEFRIDHLKEARERARELSEAGALYPWRTINGHESSAFFPAGTAQFHINADIIWGMKDYIRTTGDKALLLEGGAEMLFETARFWANFAAYVPDKGYCFHCVTGPDEYTALANNNFYTNLMAKTHLEYAWMVSQEFETQDRNKRETFEKIKADINLTKEEENRWKELTDNIYLPKVKDTAIFKQDDSFLEKSPWDWKKTPKENRPLLLHYHPLKIYRHRVMKQPDVIMGLLLERGRFSTEELKANYDFYDPLTSGDSSLSSAIQAAVAALADREDAAIHHFRKNLMLDLEDLEGNTDNGIHLAAMAGARITLLYGFAGYRITNEGPAFYPVFPENWGEVSFSILYKGVRISIQTAQEKNLGKRYMEVMAEDSIVIFIDDERFQLTKNKALRVLINQSRIIAVQNNHSNAI